MHGGVKAYKLEETLANNPYYSKVTTWVATDSGLPIERDYYDVDGKLFKSEHFEKISMVDNVPTVMKIVMNDVQSGGSSDIDVSSVKYDKQAPTRLFNPKDLPWGRQRCILERDRSVKEAGGWKEPKKCVTTVHDT
jgi:hypothetical protein